VRGDAFRGRGFGTMGLKVGVEVQRLACGASGLESRVWGAGFRVKG
jgi:hypothetical protein